MNSISVFTEYWKATSNLFASDSKTWYTLQYLAGSCFSIIAVLVGSPLSRVIGPQLGFFTSSLLFSLTLWFYYPQSFGDDILVHLK